MVDHFDVFAHRARLEDVPGFLVALPGDSQRHFVDPGGCQLNAEARVEGEDPQASLTWERSNSRFAAFEQVRLPLAGSCCFLDLVANDAAFGVDEQGAARRVSVVSLDDFDYPLQREVAGFSRSFAQIEGDNLERSRQVDHPELLRASPL